MSLEDLETWRLGDMSQSTARAMSFTYMRKMSGPRIDPRGTPRDKIPGVEHYFPILTVNERSWRQDANHEMVESLKPKDTILSRKFSWSIVSNAFCRSVKIIPVKIPFSNP